MKNSGNDKSSLPDLPQPNWRDTLHKAVKVALSSMPLGGGLASELFSALLGPPLTQRREKWFESLVEAFRDLAEQNAEVKVEKLVENEMFVTTVMHASQAAIRNHEEEKLEALRNAVLNAALPGAPGEDLQHVFLNMVDTLSPLHLKTLKFFNDPLQVFHEKPGEVAEKIHRTRAGLMEYVFPDIKGSSDLANHVLQDLSAKRLIGSDRLDAVFCMDDLLKPYTTLLGKRFLEFITSPLKSADEEARQDA